MREIFRVLNPPLRKHSALAKDSMTHPLKLIFDDDDLARHGFTEEDKQTGFLSGSNKIDRIKLILMTDTYTDAPGHSLTSRYKSSLELTGCFEDNTQIY